MLIRVVETTDEQYIGIEFPLPSPGDVMTLNGVTWHIVGVEKMDEETWKLWNYNYVAYVKEVKEGE